MDDELKGIAWEALEHPHGTKGSDWYWILGILTICTSAAAIVFGNTLLGIVIILAGLTTALLSAREAKVISYAVTSRGIRVDDRLYPFSTLESYYLDEENTIDPQLLIKSEKMLMPLIVIPIPGEYIEEIEALVGARLPEVYLEEPFVHKLLDFLGF